MHVISRKGKALWLLLFLSKNHRSTSIRYLAQFINSEKYSYPPSIFYNKIKGAFKSEKEKT